MNVNKIIKTSVLAITMSLISFSSFAVSGLDKDISGYLNEIKPCETTKKTAHIELEKSLEEIIDKEMGVLAVMIQEDINKNINLKTDIEKGFKKESFVSSSFFSIFKIGE